MKLALILVSILPTLSMALVGCLKKHGGCTGFCNGSGQCKVDKIEGKYETGVIFPCGQGSCGSGPGNGGECIAYGDAPTIC
ncbi:hypothetical protein BST61_g695 [Cercospora zeina]